MVAKTSQPVDTQKAVSIEFIQTSGGLAVKALPGQKEPAAPWTPKTNSKAKSDAILGEIAETTDNLGIHLHDNIVDVDVDANSDVIITALDMFLPSCAHVWGRKSRPRSHRVYAIRSTEPFNPADYPLLKHLGRIPEAAVEIRGGPKSRGEYSLLPGSIHPSGEPYTWADLSRARSSLSVATPEQLVRALRLSGAIAVLAPYWTEGVRNDMIMALTGFLHRVYSISESLGEGVFSLDQTEAQVFVEALLDIAGDDDEDRVSRLKTFHQTWKKANKGLPVTGATTIKQLTGDEHIIKKLYVLLADNPDMAVIEEFLAQFVIWQGPGVVVDLGAVKAGSTKPVMTRPAFANSYGHHFITIGGKRRLMAEAIFHMPSTTRIAGLTFYPGDEVFIDTKEGRKVNQWSGFDIAPCAEEVTDADVQPFVDYLKTIICRGDETIYEWVTGWLAHIFQEPADKTGTALVLVGLPGAGKSFLGHSVIMKIIGERHSATTGSIDTVIKDFNMGFEDRLWIQCDEATNNRQRAAAARLNSLITDPWVRVEPKGIDAYFKPNHARFIFTSNEVEDAMHLAHGNDDRRYTVLEVSPVRKGQIEDYWIPMGEWAKDEANLAKVHKWLLGIKYKRSFIARPLVTDAKQTMQQRSWDAFDAWLASWVSRNHPLSEETHQHWWDAPFEKSQDIVRGEWPIRVTRDALARDYAQHRRNNARFADALDAMQIGVAMEARGLKPKDPPQFTRVREWDDKKQGYVLRRVRLYVMPSRQDVVEYLTRKHGYKAEELMEGPPLTFGEDKEERF